MQFTPDRKKCLSCPPGLAPVSFSQRAVEVALNRQTKIQSWYLDIFDAGQLLGV